MVCKLVFQHGFASFTDHLPPYHLKTCVKITSNYKSMFCISIAACCTSSFDMSIKEKCQGSVIFYVLLNDALLAAINKGLEREIARVSTPDLNVTIVFVQQSKSNNKKKPISTCSNLLSCFCHTMKYQTHVTVFFTGSSIMEETPQKLIEKHMTHLGRNCWF